MKAKFTITRSALLADLCKAAEDEEFYNALFDEVLSKDLGVERVDERPGPFYAQLPDEAVMRKGQLGVIFQLTGISRGTREPKQFHAAYDHAADAVYAFVERHAPKGTKVNVFVQFCLDGEIPVARDKPGSYSSIIDHCERWVEGQAQAA